MNNNLAGWANTDPFNMDLTEIQPIVQPFTNKIIRNILEENQVRLFSFLFLKEHKDIPPKSFIDPLQKAVLANMITLSNDIASFRGKVIKNDNSFKKFPCIRENSIDFC